MGVQGVPGTNGTSGTNGATGATGPPGATVLNGATGPTGATGISGYNIAGGGTGWSLPGMTQESAAAYCPSGQSVLGGGTTGGGSGQFMVINGEPPISGGWEVWVTSTTERVQTTALQIANSHITKAWIYEL